MQSILDNESLIRISVFLGVFLIMACLEALKPRRSPSFERKKRWFANFGILILSAVLARLILPWVPISIALFAEENMLGLFNYIDFSSITSVILGIFILDLLIYLQHVVMHKLPILWRLHRLHHADLDYDVTTGIRFHPIEIILSLLYKMVIILVLGLDPVSVVIFEVILNGMAMFNHANYKLPDRLDRVLRLFVITPDVHRIHHSSIEDETNSNYGFNICWWDRLFGTYRAQPKLGHEQMEIGLSYFRDPTQLKLSKMLVQPFKSRTK